MKKITRHITSITILALFLYTGIEYSNSEPIPYLTQWENFSHSTMKVQLMKWLKDKARSIIIERNNTKSLTLSLPPYFGKLGLFITLRKNGTTRGCFGAFHHQEDDIQILLINYLSGALREDNRSTPLEIDELDDTDIIITVASQPYQVDHYNSIDLTLYGLVIECDGSQKQVFVPEELKTSFYLDKFVKGKNCHYSAFKAVTIR